MITLFYLICGHFLCDYPLQGDFLARGKNHNNPIPNVPWQQCLIAHSFIHGGMVALITGSVTLGILETVAHALIDHLKMDGFFGFNVDQVAHIVCKIFWYSLIICGCHLP